jgi:hypothetical protein
LRCPDIRVVPQAGEERRNGVSAAELLDVFRGEIQVQNVGSLERHHTSGGKNRLRSLDTFLPPSIEE